MTADELEEYAKQLAEGSPLADADRAHKAVR